MSYSSVPHIYLDANASTPIEPRVVTEVMRTMKSLCANPSSDHQAGRESAKVIESARAEVALLIGASADEIIFTSGATESINLALKGVIRTINKLPLPVVTTKIEHPAVLNSLSWLERQGSIIMHWAEIDQYGHLTPEALQASIPKEKCLICITHGNNEIGTLNNISALSQIAEKSKALLFVDAVQTAGFAAPNMTKNFVHLLCISAHKMYGPKGVGALYIRKGTTLEPMLHGGGQEYGLRAGTPNLMGIAGLGMAAKLARSEKVLRLDKISQLRERFVSIIKTGISTVVINGDPLNRVPGNVSLTIKGIEGSALRRLLPSLSFSQGSACTTETGQPSHVLRGIGLSEDECAWTIRVGLSAMNEEDEVSEAASRIVHACRRLQVRNY